jgi:hypothetical protein
VQPQTSLIVTSGYPAVLTVSASGPPPLVYQWQKNGTNLSNGGNISGSASNTLTIGVTSIADAGN